MRTRVGDGDSDEAHSLLNLAMITPGNSPTLWTALVDYGADVDEEALLSEMCARGNASAVRYLLARTEEPTTAGDSRRFLRVSSDQMRKAIRSGSDLTVEHVVGYVTRRRKGMTRAEWMRKRVDCLPLHEAVRSGTRAMLVEMLRAGADTRSIDEGMMMHTPLQEATARERWDMAAALVAFMNEDDVVRDWEGLLAERSSVSPSTSPSRVVDYYACIAPHRSLTDSEMP
ncbi:hypothetical protein CYMTET_37363 [Cymbomonas tetramitiformis]|uniref:Ankyrin repeat protein n=1 Tax=Cymbomonas tetramitiformis TaxID=36881 RepID=A0AAE0CFN6_9CHLO|nr:hypothetical protein CYMTET_46612 [Cymbomonas tetramitiformis]KAK3253364.1 hypothetical protein CYMTET_37363 [Cymbomonas tetramitiformis]